MAMNLCVENSTTDHGLSDKEFFRLSRFIHEQFGIHLSSHKKSMLEGRLRKRMRALGMESFQWYCDYLFSGEGMADELPHMVDAVTTNKTDFFREPAHFVYLAERALPELAAELDRADRKQALVWSAACSTGEEPYTLAMVLAEFAARSPGFDFSVLATDISHRVLGKAYAGIYETEKIKPVPMAMRKKYLLRSRDTTQKNVRIVPELREKIVFRRLNLAARQYDIPDTIDVVFCRNVLIYFDAPTQARLIGQFYRHITPGGYLFLGHAETITAMDVPLRCVAPTVYRKEE
jgi:chemotaxis protein methyltransferase CheR